MKRIAQLLFFILIFEAEAQYTDFPLNHRAYSIISKWQTLQGQHTFSSVKPYSRNHPIIIAPSPGGSGTFDSNLDYLKFESREFAADTVPQTKKPILRKLYRYESDFFSYSDDSFDFHINPVWQFGIGDDNKVDDLLFTNSRGVELRGMIDGKIGFYTFVTENQIEYPGYVKSVADSIGLIPFEGFWKETNTSTTDFFRTFGYVDFGITRHVSAQVGYGRHFIGSGQRSLLLSDFSNSYPYVRLSTEIWKFKYTNLFAGLIADVFTFDGGTLGASRYPKKYMMAHYLDLALTPKLNLGLFESIVFGKPDSLGGSELKLEYLNPIIFYRAVEQQDGSADNAILGADLRWTLLKNFTLYGQFVLDEMIVSEVFSSDNWWGNKFGYQLGGKYYDFIWPDLDLQIEYNWTRPFTYSHDNLFTSYTHYLQPLAHPFGANFKEIMFLLQWQPFPRLSFQNMFLSASYGVDEIFSESYGRNPNLSYNLRVGEYGHTLGQGIHTDLIMEQFTVSYHWKHNLYWDLKFTYRRETFERLIPERESTIVFAGFRWNIPDRNYWF